MIRNRCLWIALALAVGSINLIGTARAADRGMEIRFSLAPDPVTVTASGIVIDKQTGEPIIGALVRAHINAHHFQGPDSFERYPQGRTLTDHAGRYTLTLETPLAVSGPWKGKDGLCIYASAAGYETSPRYIRPNITPETTTFANCDFALSAGRRLSGILLDPKGRPVTEARVRVQNGANGDWNFFGALGQTITNERGQFELWVASAPKESLGQDPWLTILKPGEGVLFVWDILEKDDLGTLTLPPCGTIGGRVVDGQGAPIAGCEVSVRGFPCQLIAETRTDAEGKYVLHGVPGEPSIVDFYTRKNGHFTDAQGKVQVSARVDAQTDLKDAANYTLRAQDNLTVIADDLVIAEDSGVSGRLLATAGSLGLGGLMVRLDNSWDMMVEADIEGNFHFARVAPGEHKLTAYLPYNLRYDRGIGRITITAVPGVPLTDVKIPLEALAEQRVQFLDADGNPLPGITAGATWSLDGGAWTEGTVSDTDGWAVLYLYSGESQYVKGRDRSERFVTEAVSEIKPTAGAIMAPVQIVMVEAATLTGQLLDEQRAPLANQQLTCHLAYADETDTKHRVATDEDGYFTLRQIVPGVVELAVEKESLVYENVVGRVFEIEPSQTLELGPILLAGGVDKTVAMERFFDQAVLDPTELRTAAMRLLEAVRTADYTNADQWDRSPGAWKDFIDLEYCVYTDYPAWVKWVCSHLKTNPIETIELGSVSRSTSDGHWKGHHNIPAVEYKLTLRDGTKLGGTLLFDYNPDQRYWMGMYGLDWHLNDPFN